MSINDTYDYDCTKSCKFKHHGDIITAALTKRSIPDQKLASFLAITCQNFANILDSQGRNALHIASSVNRYIIVEWLINQGAHINCRDLESGESALHRALFYGCIDCAILLLRSGADINLLDKNFLYPLQVICKPEEIINSDKIKILNEVLVWGVNKNYNLGVVNYNSSNTVLLLEYFRKSNINIVNLSLSNYHSIFLDENGFVYTVGHGKGGRLGNKSENSLPSPKRVKFNFKKQKESIISVSCSKNHSLVLTNMSTVYVCGLNNDLQLGITPSPEKLTTFKEITAFSKYGTVNLIRVIANTYHSIAYNEEEIYVWGKNRGQFGFKNDVNNLTVPIMLSTSNKIIKFVESNDSTIVCYTKCSLIMLFHNYKIKILKPPVLEIIKSISVESGEDCDHTKPIKCNLRFVVLTTTNCVYLWENIVQQYTRCIFSPIRFSKVDKLLLYLNKVLVLSDGYLYTGQLSKITTSTTIEMESFQDTYSKKDITSNQKYKIIVKRIENVDRAIDVFCDDYFESFAVLVESSYKYFTVPKFVCEDYSFKSLLNETTEFDNLHDIEFIIGSECFPAHKFVIFSRSRGLMKIVKEHNNKQIHLNYLDLTGKLFEILLKHIYSNYYPTSDDFDDIQYSFGLKFNSKTPDILEILLYFSIEFELMALTNYLKRMKLGTSLNKNGIFILDFKRESYPEIYDVVIKCAGDEKIKAHKCVLVAHLEYFRIMFNNSWCETKEINLHSIPLEYMDPIITFLYGYNAENFRKQNHSENYLYNMIIICDQFLIMPLKKLCEILLSEKISIRKCGDMLQFADSYNCALLEKTCLEFISYNLVRVLEQKSLENCEYNILKKINPFYRKIYKKFFDYREITPFSNAISDQCLNISIKNFTIDLSHKIFSEKFKKKVKHVEKSSKVNQKNTSECNNITTVIEHINSPTLIDLKKTEKNEIISPNNTKYVIDDEKWVNVNDKKSNKNKFPLIAAKSNEIMKCEDSQKYNFENLNKFSISKNINKSQQNDHSIDEKLQSSPIAINTFVLNLNDFSPVLCKKMSQKQRKNSESKKDKNSSIISDKSNTSDLKSPKNVSRTKCSFAEIIKTPDDSFEFINDIPDKIEPSLENENISNFPLLSSSPKLKEKIAPCNLSKIIDDEKKQKEYIDRLKGKSLLLTQIEEKAIDELKIFYNVDEVFDEHITIERKCLKPINNYAVWKHS